LIYNSLWSFECDLFAMVTKRNQDLRGCWMADVVIRVPLIINAKWLWQTPIRYSDAAAGCGQAGTHDASFCSGDLARGDQDEVARRRGLTWIQDRKCPANISF
jgi:hypothetical protein